MFFPFQLFSQIIVGVRIFIEVAHYENESMRRKIILKGMPKILISYTYFTTSISYEVIFGDINQTGVWLRASLI